MMATTPQAGGNREAVPRGKHDILTPEGVKLRFDLADPGERFGAFLIDGVLIIAVLAACLIGLFLLAFTGIFDSASMFWVLAAVVALLFLIRSFYFAFMEIRGRGVTPGKKWLKLRVIDRSGGPLKAEAILARNLMREIEVFLPLSILMVVRSTADDSGWLTLFILVWSGLFALFPLFNRDRLRLGDLVAGTCVIRAPQTALLGDITARRARHNRTEAASQANRYRFTRQQLDVYGVRELQALEEVLRRTDVNSRSTRMEVAKRIMRRIGWEDDPAAATPFDAAAFLEAFYAAQRGKLEQGMLFGRHRRDKNDRGGTGEGK
jgi:uncharacterized RDD family membrane protein YckC